MMRNLAIIELVSHIVGIVNPSCEGRGQRQRWEWISGPNGVEGFQILNADHGKPDNVVPFQ